MIVEPASFSAHFNAVPLPAALFTAAGKRAATIEALDARSARMSVGEGCPDGSVAVLVRHGVRIVGTLRHGAEDATLFDFDDPLDGWRQARFLDDRRAARPIVVAGAVA